MISLLLILLAGCSSAPEVRDNSLHIPGVGSYFTSEIKHQVLDGVLKEETVKFSVQVKGMLVEGKEQVVQFAADTLLSLVAYESNGDLSLYISQGEFAGYQFDAAWLRFPFGGDQPITDTLSTTDESVVVWNARPSGQEGVVIDGKSFQATMVFAELRAGKMSADGYVGGIARRTYKLWYAPELGYVVREHIVSLISHGDEIDTLGVSERKLTQYEITDEHR